VQEPENPRPIRLARHAGFAARLCRLYARRFNVELTRNARSSSRGVQGGVRKPGRDHRPGDTILVPNPCYPIHFLRLHFIGRRFGRLCRSGRRWMFSAPLKNGSSISSRAPLAIVLEIFPANPTAQTVDLISTARSSFCLALRHSTLVDLDPMPNYFGVRPGPRYSKCRERARISGRVQLLSKDHSWPAGGRLCGRHAR